MSRDKQIEEMACEKCLHYEGCLKRFRKAKSDGFYEFIDETEYFAHADDCDMFIAGYRKASEVAREIFEEIERILSLNKCYGDSGIYFERDIETDIAELKKKYESEGGE